MLGSTPDEPRTLKEAMNTEEASEWKKAVQQEIDVLKKQEVWELVDLPRGRTAIKNKWVLKHKYNSDGSVERLKARLVCCGYSQRYGVDYEQTYSPVPQLKSFRIVLALAAQYDLELWQLDVVSAFLNGVLEEEIYMEQPEGFQDETGRVCLLKKALYGLKQAPHVWNSNLNTTLLSLGFKQCVRDACVYVKKEKNQIAILLVWVDDIVIASSSNKLRESIVKELSNKYEMKDKRELSWMLGMEIKHDYNTHSVTMSQKKYIEKMVKEFGMSKTKQVSTPLAPGSKLIKEKEEKTAEDKARIFAANYNAITGSLNYAANCTRPDLAYTVSTLCRFNNDPGLSHINRAKRTLRYLNATSDFGIQFVQKKEGGQVYSFSDASFASTDESKSVSGYVNFLADGPVSWSSKRQTVTAQSTWEAEFIGYAGAISEARWLSMFLEELGFPQQPITLYVDNQSAQSSSRKWSSPFKNEAFGTQL